MSHPRLEWVDESLIRFEQLYPTFPEGHFDLVFFTSPQSVKAFYFAFPENTLPAASLGEGTSRRIPAHITQLYTGSGRAEFSVNRFRKQFDGNKVVIPCGNKSLRRLQKSMPKSQFAEIMVYRTLVREVALPKCEVYAFTSPSNVDSFFSQHKVDTESAFVAIGDSTAEALRKHGKIPHIAEDFSQKAMAEAIFFALGS